MRAELANLNHCAVPFLSRAIANLCWYYYTLVGVKSLFHRPQNSENINNNRFHETILLKCIFNIYAEL